MATPVSFYVRDILIWLNIIWHEGRQNYLIGNLIEESTPDMLMRHLIDNHGFESYFLAWDDEDQYCSLRFRESLTRQYHLRIYNDGEIRGHYEYTPESYPIAHLREIDMEDRREKFMQLLKNWVNIE